MNNAESSATYEMSFAPDKYGACIYEMDNRGDAVIREALMDIGKRRTLPHQTLHSAKEYKDLVNSISGRVYSCRFKVTYKDVDVTVVLDFETKELTLQVDPDIDPQQKTHLAEFFGILSDPEYYAQKDLEEMEEIEEELQIPVYLKRLAMAAGVILIVTISLDLLNAFPEFDKLWGYLKWISLFLVVAYFVGIDLKKRQVKRQRHGNHENRDESE